MKPDGTRDRPRRDVVRSANGREEIVKRVLVRQIDDLQPGTPFVFVAMKQIVLTYSHIEKVPLRNPGRVVVVIFGSRRRYFHEIRSVF